MSTRLTKSATDQNSISTGYEGNNVPDDFQVPTCTIEDVDRALFNLFDKELPLLFKTKEATQRIPVIYATGERFAVLRRKRPLRDKNGALILPLISIMRTGVSQEAQMGPGQGGPMIIRKRLSEGDKDYQRILNKPKFKNQDDAPSIQHRIITEDGVQDTGSLPGQAATRRTDDGPIPLKYRNGNLLEADIGKNIVEVVTIPPVKYYTSTYEITFWAQYTQQMNDMIMAMMSLYQNNHRRTFRLETEKGYWFVGYVGDALSPGNNFDDFTDNERIVRYSFEVTVPGYIVGGEYPGAPSFLRKFVSAPEISFDSSQVSAAPYGEPIGSVPSGRPDRYMLQDILTDADGIPGSSIAEGDMPMGGPSATRDPRDIGGGTAAPGGTPSATIGGFSGNTSDVELVRTITDPFTGKKKTKLLKIKARNQRKGETVYREQITNDLDLLS